ncbi:hypothetical protein GALL_434770 [mine drainage metagenome]|uniref:Uncharacterized protein n=1 Tax=mine drainage metagenome TaxID=410659 RepID=A0A1J5Q4F6_9ZZZZ
MAGAEHVREEDRGRDRGDTHDHRPEQTARQRLTEPRVRHRDVRPGDEHDQGEADRRHEGEGGFGRVQGPRPHRAETDADRELADDDGQTPPAGDGQQRPGDARQADQCEKGEGHVELRTTVVGCREGSSATSRVAVCAGRVTGGTRPSSSVDRFLQDRSPPVS